MSARRNLKDQLNRCLPVAKAVKLGDLQQELIDHANSSVNALLAGHNALVTGFNALLAKLDADTALDESDYVSELELELATDETTLGASHNALVTNFNLLLVKLDADTALDEDDYEATLEATPVAAVVVTPLIVDLNARSGPGTFGGPEPE